MSDFNVEIDTSEDYIVTLGGTQGPPGTRGDLPQEPADIVASANVTIDSTVSSIYRITTDQNFTLEKPVLGVDGQRIIVQITQGVGAPHTITLGAGLNSGPIQINLSTNEGDVDMIGMMYDEPTDQWFIIAFSRGY